MPSYFGSSTLSGESAAKANEQGLAQNILFKFTCSKSIFCYSAQENSQANSVLPSNNVQELYLFVHIYLVVAVSENLKYTIF